MTRQSVIEEPGKKKCKQKQETKRNQNKNELENQTKSEKHYRTLRFLPRCSEMRNGQAVAYRGGETSEKW